MKRGKYLHSQAIHPGLQSLNSEIAVQKLSFLHRCSRAAALKACHAFAKAAAAGSGKEDDFLA